MKRLLCRSPPLHVAVRRSGSPVPGEARAVTSEVRGPWWRWRLLPTADARTNERGPVLDDPRRRTPRTDAVLADARVQAAAGRLGRARTKSVVVEVLEDCRRGDVAPEAVVEATLARLPRSPVSMRPVLNATGVVVHTNLGRAPLSTAAIEALRTAPGPTDVEL